MLRAPISSVDFTTADGPAVAGPSGDYLGRSGTLVLKPRKRTAKIVVRVLDDDVAEGDETFAVRLSNPTNAAIADPEGVAIIRDDDR